jgi:hypothetical protein
MVRQARNAVLISAAALAIGAGVAGLNGVLVRPALALSDTVALDNITIPAKDGGSVVIKHIEFNGTNLSRDEVASLFSANLPVEQARQLMAKLKALKISIPELRMSLKDGSAIIHDIQANNVDAGKVGLLSIAGIDASSLGKEGPAVSIKSNPFTLENADFAPLVRSIADAKPQAFKFSKLAWAGMEASFPDKDTPADAVGGNVVHLRIASLTANNEYQGDVFSKGVSELKGLTVEAPKASKIGKSLAPFGYDKLEFGMTSSGAYDPGTKTLALDHVTINGVNIGAMSLKMQLGGLDSGAFVGDVAQRLSSWSNGEFSNLELRVTNAGLFDRAVAYFAEQQHQKPEDIKKNWSMAVGQIVLATLLGSPQAANISTAFTQFIEAPKNLTVSAHAKSGPIAIKDLQELKTLPDILARIDFNAVANQP